MYNPVEHSSYNSGDDIVIQSPFGSLEFNEQDFKQRCEQVLRKLRLMSEEEGIHLSDEEREDAILFLTRGDEFEPQTDLWIRVTQFLADMDDTIGIEGEADDMSQADHLRHAILKALFGQAWLDNQVKQGKLKLVFDDVTGDFQYAPAMESDSTGKGLGKYLGLNAIRTAFKTWRSSR